MGGKNGIIVDDDADLDEAVLGVVKQRVRLSGAKMFGLLAGDRAGRASTMHSCQRLIEATRSLKVGPAEDPATSVGPDRRRIVRRACGEYLEVGRQDTDAKRWPSTPGPWPTRVFRGPRTFSPTYPRRAGWPRKRFSVPCWSCCGPRTWTKRSESVNDTDYALTGGIFSRSPRTFPAHPARNSVGNLYLNRGITGALVGRQPFGGFKISGIGTKAGGPEYLLQFVVPQP